MRRDSERKFINVNKGDSLGAATPLGRREPSEPFSDFFRLPVWTLAFCSQALSVNMSVTMGLAALIFY